MDLYVVIADEDETILQVINIYQDGSDSEGAELIAEIIKKIFPSAKNITEEANGL